MKIAKLNSHELEHENRVMIVHTFNICRLVYLVNIYYNYVVVKYTMYIVPYSITCYQNLKSTLPYHTVRNCIRLIKLYMQIVNICITILYHSKIPTMKSTLHSHIICMCVVCTIPLVMYDWTFFLTLRTNFCITFLEPMK